MSSIGFSTVASHEKVVDLCRFQILSINVNSLPFENKVLAQGSMMDVRPISPLLSPLTL